MPLYKPTLKLNSDLQGTGLYKKLNLFRKFAPRETSGPDLACKVIDSAFNYINCK